MQAEKLGGFAHVAAGFVDGLLDVLALESIGWSQYAVNDYSSALQSMEECVQSYRNFGSAKLVTRGRVAVGQMLAALGHVNPSRERDLANTLVDVPHDFCERTIGCIRLHRDNEIRVEVGDLRRSESLTDRRDLTEG